MARNLDLSALRSFVAVADTGGVTRAAGLVNLTQSAVSMQMKRLEETLGVALFDRAPRGLTLTAAGAQLLGHARRMVATNDEVFLRLTDRAHEGEISLGVPHDLIGPVVPAVLRQMAAAFPRVRVSLVSLMTRELKDAFARGDLPVIVTTEVQAGPSGETMARVPLEWKGAPGGTAWRRRPLPVASEPICAFRTAMLASLDAAGIPWQLVLEATYTRAIEAAVEADLAVYTQLAGTSAPGIVPVDHGGALPVLPDFAINLYRAPTLTGPAADALSDMLRAGYRSLSLESSPRPSLSRPGSAEDPGPLQRAIAAACG
jgi:DNA-binding transcriptional LysR family regulator